MTFVLYFLKIARRVLVLRLLQNDYDKLKTSICVYVVLDINRLLLYNIFKTRFFGTRWV